MKSRLLEIQYRRKEGLLLEQQKDNDNVVKKSLMDIGVILDGTFTFGTGITAFLPIVRDLINLEQPQITEQSIILVYITAMWIILNRHQDKVKKLLQIIREQGLNDALTRIVDFLKSLENVVLKVADEVGYAASSIADVGAFTFLAFPILDGLVALINSGDITFGEPAGYLKSVLISIGILSVKNIFNSIITSIKSKFGTLEESRHILKYNDCGISEDVLKVITKTLFSESKELWVLPKDINTSNRYIFHENSHVLELEISRNVKLKENYSLEIREGDSHNFKLSLEINPLSEPNVYRDIKLTLKECFGKYGYSPITLTLNEQKSFAKTKTVFEDDTYKIVVPLDMTTFCELADKTSWCNYFSHVPYKGTFYVIYEKNFNNKFLVHDTGRIFLLREPNSAGNHYRVHPPISDTIYDTIDIKKHLSDKPKLIEFFNLNYTPNDLLKYGMSLSNEKLIEYSKTNKFAQTVFKIIKENKNNLTTEKIENTLQPYLGEKVKYASDWLETDEMLLEVFSDGVIWRMGEEVYENDILNVGDEGDGWYYNLAMHGGTMDHDYLEDEELDYLSNHLNDTVINRLSQILDTLGVSHTTEQLSEEGEIQDFLSKYFPKKWGNTGDDILWELGQGLGEYRNEALKKNLENELTLIPEPTRSGYKLDLNYTQLLSLIYQYDLKTFSDILNSGFNELTYSLHEAWYDEWGYSDDTDKEIIRLFTNFLDEIEEDETLVSRKDNIEKLDRIIKDLDFIRDGGNATWSKQWKWGEDKMYGKLSNFKPETGMVTLQIGDSPIRIWNPGDSKKYEIDIDEVGDYIGTPDLFASSTKTN
tara:strand:- start:17224 stop:19683 length:2460 start_codon:yes stop_codon:yes gene_type:complete